jgi:hypothetical protein
VVRFGHFSVFSSCNALIKANAALPQLCAMSHIICFRSFPMGSANLNITVTEVRLLKLGEAASYAGVAAKHFKSLCPVRPVELQPGTKLWDKRDLDGWIDSVKTDEHSFTQDTILGRLK